MKSKKPTHQYLYFEINPAKLTLELTHKFAMYGIHVNGNNLCVNR